MFDIRDLMLEAEAEVQAIMREVVQDLVRPQMMAQIKQMWMTAPDEIKESFKRERPQEYAELMEDLKPNKRR
jgi:hypothetical protein